jgi:hypothetical protein
MRKRTTFVATRQTQTGGQFHRLWACPGANKAILAVAAKVLTAAYHILKKRIEYKPLVPDTSLAAIDPLRRPQRPAQPKSGRSPGYEDSQHAHRHIYNLATALRGKLAVCLRSDGSPLCESPQLIRTRRSESRLGAMANVEFELAEQFALHTRRHCFVTGKGGTGKTTLLRRLAERTQKNVAVVAPTGIAAVNAGGVTIHSMFGLPLTCAQVASSIPSSRQAKGGIFKDTLDLHRQGKTAEEIAAIRGLSIGTIKSHFARWIASGDIDVYDVLPAETINPVLAFLQENESATVTAIRSGTGARVIDSTTTTTTISG